MALNNAVLTWNANSEPDLAGYTIYWGMVPGVWTSTTTTTNTTITLTSGSFNSDGTWYFSIDAFDTSGNHSSTFLPYRSKRIVRVGNRIKRRK